MKLNLSSRDDVQHLQYGPTKWNTSECKWCNTWLWTIIVVAYLLECGSGAHVPLAKNMSTKFWWIYIPSLNERWSTIQLIGFAIHQVWLYAYMYMRKRKVKGDGVQCSKDVCYSGLCLHAFGFPWGTIVPLWVCRCLFVQTKIDSWLRDHIATFWPNDQTYRAVGWF